MSKQNIDLSIIIVSFNTKDLLRICLRSLQNIRSKGLRWEIIVVDNGSGDDSVGMVKKEFPDVILIELSNNQGFACANNLGIKKSSGSYVLLLNSDTEVNSSAIGSVLEFLIQHKEAGAATCKLLLPSGTIDPACHRGFPTPWASLTYVVGLENIFPQSRIFGRYHLGYMDMSSIHEIDSPSGAFYMVCRKVIEEVGLLDENFFMYGEDLDWSYRIKNVGWKIYYVPSASILHRKKQSGRENADSDIKKKTNRYFYETMKFFYKKHYQHRYSPFVTFFVNAILSIRIKFIRA